MPKKIDDELKARAVRLVNEHQGGYSSLTAAAAVMAGARRPWTRDWWRAQPRRESALDSCPVSPTWSASSRAAAADPANATTPDPAPVTDNPCAHPLRFT